VSALLFNVSPTDVASYAGSTLLLVLVGIAASWWPARRAAGVNPADALRAE
jgi:putative ABC transport system permease protein